MSAAPWKGEPDRVEFTAHGLPCLVLRGPVGALNGYVGIPPGHRFHGKGYDEVSANVHGGLTYADESSRFVDLGEGYWVFGFDCAHAGDAFPGGINLPGWKYRDIAYVRGEAERLAAQMADCLLPSQPSAVPEEYMSDGPWEVA